MTGYPEAELIGKDCHRLTDLGDGRIDAIARAELIGADGTLAFETRYARKDGATIFVYVSATRIAQDAADSTILMTVIDITEQRRAEQIARRSEQRYRTLLNSLDVGFCVIEVIFEGADRAVDYRFLEINEPFERLTGLANVKGATMRELVPEHESHWFEVYGRVALTGEPTRFEAEARALHRWYSVYAFRADSSNNRQVGILFEDISARRIGEQRRLFLSNLAEKLAPLRLEAEVVETVVGALGRFLNVDRCAFAECLEAENRLVISSDYARPGLPSLTGELNLFEFGGIEWWRAISGEGLSVDDVALHPLTEPHPEAYQAIGIRSYLAKTFRGAGPWTSGLVVGNLKPRAWNAEDMKLVDDVLARVWPMIERARSDRALVEAHAELERRVADRTAKLRETISELEAYSYSISHDLRAPLRAMQSYASIVAEERGAVLGDSGREYMRRIEAAADRMDRLIRDLLVVTRLSREAMPIERIELGSFIAGVMDNYPGLRVNTAQIELVAPLGAVRANPAALTQCVANLLGNAIKFVAPGVKPHIRIWSELSGGRRRVFFRDNGIGIAESAREKIFGMFYQTDPSQEGTGVGLAIVKKAVERMGGTVGVTDSLGHGSTFWLELSDAGGGVAL